MPITDIPIDVLARAAARRYLATEHRVIVRTIDRHYVAEAVLAEAAARGFDDQADIDITVMDAAIEQIKAARFVATWPDETQPCGFNARNPASGKLARCVSPAEVTVIVAATPPSGRFYGVGVETRVCADHGKQLVEEYGAVPVPTEDED